jgi:hypothetical protein
LTTVATLAVDVATTLPTLLITLADEAVEVVTPLPTLFTMEVDEAVLALTVWLNVCKGGVRCTGAWA